MKRTTSIEKIDLLGTRLNFYIGEKKLRKLKSVFGGILSLFFILFMITAIYVFGRKWLKKNHPVVSVNSFYSKRDHYYDLYQSNIFLAFGMFDGVKFPKTEQTKRFFTLKAQYETVILDATITAERRTTIQPFPVVKCEHQNNNYTDFVSKTFSQDAATFYRGSIFCTDTLADTNWKIRGSTFELPFSMIRVRVYPCSLEDPSECASPTELANSLFAIPIASKSADFRNFSHPLKDGIDTDLTAQFSLSIMTQLTIWFRECSIFDENIDFVENFGARVNYIEQHKVTSAIQNRDARTHCTDIQIEDGNCQPYIEILVRASQSTTRVERRYYKLLNLISDAGGFAELVFILFTFASYWFHAYYRKKWMRRQLYKGLIEIQSDEKNQESMNTEHPEPDNSQQKGYAAQNEKTEEGYNHGEYLDSQARDSLSNTKKDSILQEKSNTQDQKKNKAKEENEMGNLSNQLNKLRAKFDYFELLDASKKCKILSAIFFQEFHDALMPLVIYSNKKRNKNEPKNKNKPHEQKEITHSEEVESIKFSFNKYQASKLSAIYLKTIEEEINHPVTRRSGTRFDADPKIATPVKIHSNKRNGIKIDDISSLITFTLLKKLHQTQKNKKTYTFQHFSLNSNYYRFQSSSGSSSTRTMNLDQEDWGSSTKRSKTSEFSSPVDWREKKFSQFKQGAMIEITNRSLRGKEYEREPEIFIFGDPEKNQKKSKRVPIGEELLQRRKKGIMRKRRNMALKLDQARRLKSKTLSKGVDSQHDVGKGEELNQGLKKKKKRKKGKEGRKKARKHKRLKISSAKKRRRIGLSQHSERSSHFKKYEDSNKKDADSIEEEH